MKSLILVSIMLAAGQSPAALGSVLNKAILDSVIGVITETCTPANGADECFAQIRKIRNDQNYGHPAIQFRISEGLVAISGTYPTVLDIAYDILTELAETYPENREYLSQRAFVRYLQDPIAGFWEAKENNNPGMLSVILRGYLMSGSIQQDIKTFAIDEFKLGIIRTEAMLMILASAKLALEVIAEYGDEAQVETFISDARTLIPWAAWRENEWGKLTSTTEFSSSLARTVLFTHCQPIMLRLDDGAYCADATELISEVATQEVLADVEFKNVARWLISSTEDLHPPKIGNALQLLEQLTGTEHQ